MFKPTNANRVPTLTRVLILLSGCTLGFFLTFVLGGWIQSQVNSSPISSVRGLAATVPYQYFAEMMANEIPHMELDESEYTAFSKKTVSDFMLSILTGIKTDDPRTLLAQEIPGLDREKAVQLRGADSDPAATTSPREFTPSEDKLQPVGDGELPDPLWPDDLDAYMEDEQPVEEVNNEKKKNVFIYTSHNRESWIPELDGVTDMEDAFHPEINVTLLSERMAEKFEASGIGALSADIDYPTSIPSYSWNSSYSYSLQSVREANAAYPELVYFFDIHRDAQPRKYTTATINGEDYAQLYFIIGHRNPNWKENEAFAAEIHERIESKLPGISRGVWSKSASSGHAEYNQSFSNRSLLIEVGGPENTLEESNRTIDALTEVLAEFIWEETTPKAEVPVQANEGGS